MENDVLNYKCPSCTGPLHFVGKSQRLECEYCGNNYDVSEIEKLYKVEDFKEKNIDVVEADDWAKGMKAYKCPSCSAELICEPTTSATSCPYCGNNTIIESQLRGVYKPKYIIPFKLSKEDAIKALKHHYSNKFFLPKNFLDANHIEEIKGVYVPFWLIDSTLDVSSTYKASKSYSRRTGDYVVKTTSHYNIFRSAEIPFDNIPVDASIKMPDDYMNSIEPYNYNEIQDFSRGYLAGFFADKFDVDKEKCLTIAHNRAYFSSKDYINKSVFGYESIREVSSTFTAYNKASDYTLMPVWLLSTRWNNKSFLFAMNGQTGKLIGDLPVDRTKYLITYLIFALVFAIILYFFGVSDAISRFILRLVV